ERTASWLARNPILVTALNPIIGYNNGARVAKQALAEGKSVREVVLELGLMEAAELDAALDAYAMTEGGIAR
ncbi:MAG: aspartate ammonia-lyase, partial [Chloroflexi bacterium]|nr:aspartate ammonia-lyase [Chloroflexota bacterium]